ncbi:hypothetical protein [Pectobacterium brasiliense]|uniref:hypothetical protein n=1 Tax=Pectobacterium brasiliense TaxID=180957 RepID=UPI001F0B25AA|nr:hypothetical protein [Pectobacterium brasiliense]
MARVKRVDHSKIMTASEVARYLLNNCKSLVLYESFMFGSSLLGIGCDYDILIIGPSGDALHKLKDELKIAGAELPLDILYMLPIEAEETLFVKKQKCVSLSLLATQGS